MNLTEREKSSWEEESPLRDSDTFENWDKSIFSLLSLYNNGTTESEQAWNDGPFPSNQSFFFMTTAAVKMICKYRNRVADNKISLERALNCGWKPLLKGEKRKNTFVPTKSHPPFPKDVS